MILSSVTIAEQIKIFYDSGYLGFDVVMQAADNLVAISFCKTFWPSVHHWLSGGA